MRNLKLALAHPVPDAVRHRCRDPVAGARHRRQRGDLLDLQPDAAVALPVQEPAGWSTSRRPARSRARSRAATPATASTSSATRCSATCRRCRPSSRTSRRTCSFGANLAFDGQTISGSGMLVSGSYFPVLGVQPALGRLLASAGRSEDRRIRGRRAQPRLLDHARSAQRADVINQTMIVNGQTLTIVGVAPPGSRGRRSARTPEVFVPITLRGADAAGLQRRSPTAGATGRTCSRG